MPILRMVPILAFMTVVIAGLVGPPAAFARQPTAGQITAIRSKCPADYRSYCASVPPGGQAALACLAKNIGSLSAACKDAVSAATGAEPAPAAPAAASDGAASAPAAGTAAPTVAPAPPAASTAAPAAPAARLPHAPGGAGPLAARRTGHHQICLRARCSVALRRHAARRRADHRLPRRPSRVALAALRQSARGRAATVTAARALRAERGRHVDV